MASKWNMFVKKIYHAGRKQNNNYSFKDALKEASARKGEMSSMGDMGTMKSMKKRGGKSKKRGGKSKKHRTRSR